MSRSKINRFGTNQGSSPSLSKRKRQISRANLPPFTLPSIPVHISREMLCHHRICFHQSTWSIQHAYLKVTPCNEQLCHAAITYWCSYWDTAGWKTLLPCLIECIDCNDFWHWYAVKCSQMLSALSNLWMMHWLVSKDKILTFSGCFFSIISPIPTKIEIIKIDYASNVT